MSETMNNEAVSTAHSNDPLLRVSNLQVDFQTTHGVVHAVQDVSFSVYPRQWVAIVGESGSGKSTSAMAVLGLLPGSGKVTGGSITLNGKELANLSQREFEEIRGTQIGLVPQDPMSNLNPVWTVGSQIKEAFKANNIDISREKRSQFIQSLSSEHRPVDDELFIASEQRDELLRVARAALQEANVATVDQTMEEFEETWVAGSYTRWRVRENLVAAGVPQERARTIAEQYVTGAQMNDRIAGVLSEAGLPNAAIRAKQYPHEFSGGMRQRALIAMGLASRPDLLIADEPTSALDVTVQKKILDHLQVLTDSLGTAVLFVTHDLGLAAERSQHIVVMYKGHVVESGPSLEVLQNPQHPYTKRLVAAAPSLASRRMVSLHKASTLSAGKEDIVVAHESAKELHNATVESHSVSSVPSQSDDVVIAVRNLTKEFKLPRQQAMFKAVDNVSFDLHRGRTLAIVGESGSGKSTVANMILHLLEPTSGNVYYEGVDTATFNKKQMLQFRRHVQPVFQNPYGSLDPMYSIYRSIEEPLKIHHVGDKKSRLQRVRELLDMVEMPESTMHRFPSELSGGQRQRIAIARAMALNPDIIVCDEAVSALDVLVQDQVLHLLNDLQAQRNLTYLFITHDLAVVRQIADEVLVMQHGSMVEHASTDEVFDNPQEQYTRDLLAAIPGGNLQLGLEL